MKRKFTVLITCLLLAALSLFAFSCAGQEQPSPAAEYTDLSAEEAKAKIDEGISSVKGPDNLTGHRSSGKLDSNQTINYRREKR